ncbi:hypothetical protein MD484_g7619, partial [Candolleomyces efflorescens]
MDDINSYLTSYEDGIFSCGNTVVSSSLFHPGVDCGARGENSGATPPPLSPSPQPEPQASEPINSDIERFDKAAVLLTLFQRSRHVFIDPGWAIPELPPQLPDKPRSALGGSGFVEVGDDIDAKRTALIESEIPLSDDIKITPGVKASEVNGDRLTPLQREDDSSDSDESEDDWLARAFEEDADGAQQQK